MSNASENFEREIVTMVHHHIGESLPDSLPRWMIEEGIVPGAIINSVDGIGSWSHMNKTDVIIRLNQGEPIKISAKLRNADYFGNWYGHKRFLEEFGEAAFYRMTKAATDFANKWVNCTDAPFVGVSICFGRRTGNTGQNFLDIFTTQDILTVAKGFGHSDSTANCMYISNHSALNIPDLIMNLNEISEYNINKATETFKVIYRPINPLTEGSNRGKSVYTRFKPYQPLTHPKEIQNAAELFSLGEFVVVEPTRLNHNQILDDLRYNYNIIIPRK